MITDPVEVKVPIVESSRERVFKGSGVPTFYRVEAVCPDGTTKVIENVRAYTESLQVDEQTGRVQIVLGSDRAEYRARVGYPYYYLHSGNVLCSLKCYGMRNRTDSDFLGFGLNYNLFEISWQLCLILHQLEGKTMAFVTSRMEWDRGNIGVENREVQMFLRVPQERHVPTHLMKLMMASEIVEWMDFCEQTINRKAL